MKTRQMYTILFLLVLTICFSLLSATVFADGNEKIVLEDVIIEAEESTAEAQDSVIPEDPEPIMEDISEDSDDVCAEASPAFSGESAHEETDYEGNEDETVEESVEAEPEIFFEPGAENDNDDLFRSYFEELLMPHPRLRRPVGASNLSGVDLTAYYLLAEKTNSVAEQGGSTIFDFSLSEYGIQLSWTQEELGGITIISGGKITQEAKDAVAERLNIGNISLICSALQQDYPFGMFWNDKITGVTVNKIYILSASSSRISIISGQATYSFAVSPDYGSNYEVDASEVSRAQTAAEKAKAIVAAWMEFSDDEKLAGYRDEICSLTSYDSAAASGGVPYGDPWQAIYVFDGDPQTKVVCEGYSKAFEYLCDMSSFASSTVSCISVTGALNGDNHMWNIVTLYDGKNYLADVTNSDGGSTSRESGLFLVGCSEGNVQSGYVIMHDGIRTFYEYDTNTKALMTESELTLARTVNSYTITWQNDDGSVIDTTTVEYGKMPSHADAAKAATAEYTYTFAGWTPEIVAVTGDATYKAAFTETKNSYLIVWKDGNGKVLQSKEVAYGEMPAYTSDEVPTKAPTAEVSYTWDNGWDPEVTEVAGEATYTATFTESPREYTVTFMNEGNVYSEVKVKFNELAAKPDDPVTEQLGVKFAGWYDGDAEFDFSTPIIGNLTLTAKYEPVIPPEDPAEAFVRRSYSLMLGREASAEEVQFYADQLKAEELTGAQMVSNFMNSPEFAVIASKLSSEEIVGIIYETMLDRVPSEEEAAYHAANLDKGYSYNAVINCFSQSPEFLDICEEAGIEAGTAAEMWRDKNILVTAFVKRNYKLTLVRDAAGEELDYYCERLLQKYETPQQVANHFVFSPECVGRGLSDEQFITILYNLYMDRDPDADGLAYYIGLLASGVSREQIDANFGASEEFAEIVKRYGL